MRLSCEFIGFLIFVFTILSVTGSENFDHEPNGLGKADSTESNGLALPNAHDACSSDTNHRTNSPHVRRRGKVCAPRKAPMRGSNLHEDGVIRSPKLDTSPESREENAAFPFDEFDNYELCPVDRYGLLNSIPICDSGKVTDRAYQLDGSWRLFHVTLCELFTVPFRSVFLNQ